MKHTPWNELTDGLLAEMVAQGMGCTQISRRFEEAHGIIFSRNSIIGRRSRMRKGGKIPALLPRPNREAVVRKPERKAPWKPFGHEPSPPEPIFASKEPSSPAPEGGVRLLDLGPLPPAAERCRYPLGPTMAKAEFFCGAVPLPNGVYCKPCARMAYSPGNPRRP